MAHQAHAQQQTYSISFPQGTIFTQPLPQQYFAQPTAFAVTVYKNNQPFSSQRVYTTVSLSPVHILYAQLTPYAAQPALNQNQYVRTPQQPIYKSQQEILKTLVASAFSNSLLTSRHPLLPSKSQQAHAQRLSIKLSKDK